MSALRPVLRIAYRDALRAKGRSALIALMIGLPVFGLTFADVIGHTAQPDADEEVTRQLGATQYVMRAEAPRGSGFAQAPDPLEGSTSLGEPSGRPRYAEPAELLPARGRTLSAASSTVEVRTRGGVGEVDWHEVRAADRAFAGRFEVLSGRAPRLASEVLTTPELLERTGARVGGRLEALEPAKVVRVVGTARQEGTLGEEAIYALPGTLISAPGGIAKEAAARALYVYGAPPLTWAQVEKLNAEGVSAYDRDLVQDPPPRSEVAYYAKGFGSGGGDSLDFTLILVGAVVIGLAALEVVLLAGAAFAVGARRQARSLALLVATGGSVRHVRLVVLAGGLVLGAVAAGIGVGAGIIVAALARAPFESLTQTPFARFDVRPLELMAIASLGLVTGLLAAVVPARAAMRQDVVAALGGRRGAVRTRRRVPILGIVITLFGVAAATVGSLWTAAESAANVAGGQGYLIAALIAGGAGLALVGLVVLSPAIMGLVGRLAAHLPLAARLVARDASRHRGRTAPAMAAVLAAVSGSAALVLYVSAMDDRDQRSYGPALPYGNAGVTLLDYGDGGVGRLADGTIRDAGPVVRAVEGQLPVAASTVVRQVRHCPSGDCQTAQLTTPPANVCPVQVGDEEAMRAAAKRDWRCPGPEVANRQVAGGGIGSGTPAVGDAALLETLYGVDDPGAARALAAGGVVVFSRAEVLNRRASFDVFAPGALNQGPPPGEEDTWQGPKPTATVSLPAFAATSTSAGQGQAFLSPTAARRMGLRSAPSYAYFELTRLPTQEEQDAADAAIATTGAEIPLTVERGYVSAYGLGLLALILAAAVVTLGAAGIATGLAQADARADHATLAAVGAAPRLRRKLAGLQALLIAGLGTALGVAVGFVPAVALIGAVDSLQLTLPWLRLAGMIVGVPLMAAVAAWACTRSRLPLGRRAEA